MCGGIRMDSLITGRSASWRTVTRSAPCTVDDAQQRAAHCLDDACLGAFAGCTVFERRIISRMPPVLGRKVGHGSGSPHVSASFVRAIARKRGPQECRGLGVRLPGGRWPWRV